MKAGDKVRIVISPYSLVPAGTVAALKEIIKDHFGEGRHLYVTTGLPCNNFREFEIVSVNVKPK